MTITLDHATKERLQHEMLRGGFASEGEVIRAALDLMQGAQSDAREWRVRFDTMLDERMSNIDEGLVYTPEEAKAKLAELRTKSTG